MAQQHRSVISLLMLQDLESYYKGTKDTLIGNEQVFQYSQSYLAITGSPTPFGMLFLTSLHLEIHRQVIVGMTREAKAKSLPFETQVSELSDFLINKTIGNYFSSYCS
jgi:hypothetical protein